MTTIVSQSSTSSSLKTTLLSGFGAMTLAALVLAPWGHPCPQGAGPGTVINTVRVVDVTASFTTEGYDAWSSLGGIAAEVPLSNPAHIFRFQPSDRTDAEIDRHTFFLEDPAHAPSCHAHSSTLSVTAPTNIDADILVYRIEGDLVIDNDHARSIRLFTRPHQSVVFDVEGDIIFGDNLLLASRFDDVTFRARPGIDGVGGNIILSDATYGTLSVIEANLDADRLITGRVNSQGVLIRGDVVERSVERGFDL